MKDFRRLKIISAAFLVFVLLFIPACAPGKVIQTAPESSKAGEASEELTLFGIGPRTLDPALVRETTSSAYVSEIFSGLVSFDPELKLVPDIAKDWEVSSDGRTYTFFLRGGVRFHSGEEVTAQDFKYSFERACDPETGSKTAATYLGDIVGAKKKLSGEVEEVKGIEVIDEYTLQITIDSPKAYFLQKLAHPCAFVVDRENVESGENWWRHPNGSGPFKLKKWEKGKLLVLKRNNSYYGKLPDVEKVKFKLWRGVPIRMYERGEIDLTHVSRVNIERVLDPENPLHQELVPVPKLSLSYIGFNCSKPPFDNPKVRKAFCLAVDKEKIIRLTLKGMAKKANGILPPRLPGHNPELKGLAFDPEKAKKLIRQSKYGNVDNLPSIILTAPGRGYLSNLSGALVDMWRRHLGVEVKVKQLEPEKYAYLLEKEKDEMFRMGWMADYPDPQNFLDILFHGQSEENFGSYSNPKVDKLLEKARKERDAQTRLKIYHQAEKLLIQDAACLPLYFPIDYVLVKPYVKNFVGTSMPIPWLKYVQVEKNEPRT